MSLGQVATSRDPAVMAKISLTFSAFWSPRGPRQRKNRCGATGLKTAVGYASTGSRKKRKKFLWKSQYKPCNLAMYCIQLRSTVDLLTRWIFQINQPILHPKQEQKKLRHLNFPQGTGRANSRNLRRVLGKWQKLIKTFNLKKKYWRCDTEHNVSM